MPTSEQGALREAAKLGYPMRHGLPWLVRVLKTQWKQRKCSGLSLTSRAC